MINTFITVMAKIQKTSTLCLVKVFKKGGGGIRTHGTFDRTTVFKTAPINRSGTPPEILPVPYYIFIIIVLKCKEDD